MTSHYSGDSVTTVHDFEGVLDGLWTLLSFGLSQFHGHGTWLVCEVAFTEPEVPELFECTKDYGRRILGTGGQDRFGQRQGFQPSDASHV